MNWILISGRYGFPELGIKGAAIGTLIARVMELIILITYIVVKEQKLQWKLKDFFYIEKSFVKRYMLLLGPILLGSAMWGINTALQTAILGHMSISAITANSVAANLFLLVKTAAVGAASASSVIIGKAIGEGSLELVQTYAKRLQCMYVAIGIISGCLLYTLIDPVLSLYSLSEESYELAKSFLKILSIVIVFMSYQMPTNVGLIRGAGGTKYVMIVDMISIYLIVLPLSFFMAFVVDASPIIVVVCMNLDQFFKGIPGFIKVNCCKWIHKLA